MFTGKIRIKRRLRRDTVKQEKSYEVASQWQLMWWSFRNHRLAMLSGVVIILLYLTAVFAGFIAPYDVSTRNPKYQFAPPQKLRFIDETGFTFRPFVYGYKTEINLETLERVYTVDKSQKYPIHFFVRGSEYKTLGLFSSNIRLFGTANNEGYVYLMGTDGLGRDLFSRIIYGGRISMSIGLVGVCLSFVLGLLIGGISGHCGGIVDKVIQRIIEIIHCFPKIPLWMGLSAALPSHWSPIRMYFMITVILSIVGWTSLARVVRGKILSLKNEDFVVAARLVGMSEGKILISHLIPSFMSHIIAAITLAVPQMILAETSLSFLGLGLRSPAVSWGVLLRSAQNIHAIAVAPWVLTPGVFVIIFVLAFNFLGDGLRDAADPYSK